MEEDKICSICGDIIQDDDGSGICLNCQEGLEEEWPERDLMLMRSFEIFR